MPATLMAEVEAWATANDATRSAAIRRLLELGLTVRVKPTQLNATRAKELAAKVIDNLADGAANADDRASRKSRLLKGPEEFRKARVDWPKATKMTKTPGEIEAPKQITRAEREARRAFRQVDDATAMSEYEIAQTAFSKNRERLKAERLAREAAAAPPTKAKTKAKKK
jgi:hypothetical protein